MSPSNTVWRISLPYKQRHHTAKISATVRDLLLLQVMLEEQVWIAEFAPLPPFSEESIDDVIAYLPDVAQWIETWIPFNLPAKAEESIPLTWPKSLQWGISSMVWSKSLSKTRSEDDTNPLGVHTLLPPGDEAKALSEASSKDHAFKVKIHPESWESLFRTIKTYHEHHPRSRWVIDVNEKGSFEWLKEVDVWCKSHQFDAIQYIEDPMVVNSPEEVRELIEQSPLRLGFDEFLQPRRRQDHFELKEGIESIKGGVCVIKPALYGTRNECIQMTQLANKAGVPVVLSTLMESSIGRTSAAHIAQLHGSSSYTHGLGTGHLFVMDLDPTWDKLQQTLEVLPINPVICYTKTSLT